MKQQPDRNYLSNDDIQTPPTLARQIVQHFAPFGLVMEPCYGGGNFFKALIDCPTLIGVGHCEIKEGNDFLHYDAAGVDWIVTNPPWSKIRAFLQKSFEVADNVVFLMTVNHAFTTARERLTREADFGLREIYLVDWPMTFPKCGFLLGAMHWQRGYSGPIHWNDGRNAEYMTRRLFEDAASYLQCWFARAECRSDIAIETNRRARSVRARYIFGDDE